MIADPRAHKVGITLGQHQVSTIFGAAQFRNSRISEAMDLSDRCWTPENNLAKVGVEGSNPFSRSKSRIHPDPTRDGAAANAAGLLALVLDAGLSDRLSVALSARALRVA